MDQMKLTQEQNRELLTKVILLLREYDIGKTNPYEIENWVSDYCCCHSELFKTGLFEEE